MKKFIILLLIVLLCGTVFLSGCSDKTEQKAATPSNEPPNEIKIGILEPISGSLAPLGESETNGHKFAVDEINAAGGIKALGGAKLKLVIADTKGEPQTGLSEAERLITQEKVNVIFGAYSSGVTYPTTEVAEKYGIPYFVPGAVKDEITDRGFKWVARLAPKGSWYTRDIFYFIRDMNKQAQEKDQMKNLAIVFENTDYGHSIADIAQKFADEIGAKIVLSEPYPAGSSDLSPVIIKLKQKQPDAVIFVSYVSDAILLAKTIKEMNFKAKAFIGGGGGFIDPSFIKAVGQDSENWYSLTEWNYDLSKPLAKEKNEAFKAKYGVYMGPSAQTYSATYVIADALERAASLDPAKIQKAIMETSLSSGPALILPCSKIEFDQTGQNKYATLIMTQIQNGDYHTVWPFDAASMKPIFPMP